MRKVIAIVRMCFLQSVIFRPALSLIAFFLISLPSFSQDSTIARLQQLPLKYLNQVSSKADKYYNSITSKTEKTLEKLARWEEKIHTLLQKASPETAQRLFGNNQLTFADVLKKYKETKAAADVYKAQYNEYRDKLTNSIRYLDEQKNKLDKNIVQPVKGTKEKINRLNNQLDNTEAVEQFIKERKKQLIQQAVQIIGKSKYLQKINKEAYYYVEILKNYQEIFNDPKKAEELAVKILEKIPAFNEFFQKNSMYSSIFAGGGNSVPTTNYAALGYQSNAMVARQIQQSGVGGPNSIQSLTQTNANTFNSPLQELKNRFPNLSGTEDMPDFKPNAMKSKTFKQRLQFGTNFQFGKATNFLPGTADLGLQLAYKLNSKSNIGLGTNYKLGLGTGWDNIKISSEGIGFRSFLDWKLKANFFVNGGFEYNYYSSFKSLRDLPAFNNSSVSLWKPSTLLGINKKYSVGKMKGNMMVLYDFLGKQRTPQTQSLIFRFGYNF